MSENNINESISPDINTNGACPQQEAAAHCAEKAQDPRQEGTEPGSIIGLLCGIAAAVIFAPGIAGQIVPLWYSLIYCLTFAQGNAVIFSAVNYVIFALIFLCLITAGAILCKRKRLYWLVTSGSALIIYLLTLMYTYAYLT